MNEKHCRLLIIGSGPAGYTAAVYAARANLNPVLVTGLEQGGQLTTTTDVDNWPGDHEGVQGPDLMERMRKHAERFETEIIFDSITTVDLKQHPFRLTGDSNQYTCDALIIATGASAQYLGLPSEQAFRSKGVSACATCDGFFYRGKDVAVVGGGDTAAEEATYLAGLCNKVYLIVRKPFLRASKAMQDRVNRTENIEVLYEHNTKEITGDGVVQGATLIKRLGHEDEQEVTINVDGFFLAIGHTPNSDFFKQYITTDENGYVITEPDSTRTNVPGVFACGDLKDSVYRQAVTSAGSGCMAAIDAEKFLAERE